MARQPRIPMLPSALPQQRLYLVKGMPVSPPGWALLDAQNLKSLREARMPRSARYLGLLEWAWSPMHSRLSAYYLSMDRSHRYWVLWLKSYDTNWDRWQEPRVAGASLRRGVEGRAAAKLLLANVWAIEGDDGLDRFGWVGESGFLEAGELNEIADAVWGGDDTGEADETDE